jgi:hypothetical protein
VLVQDGDFYGPVVNLASRLVGVANPGTVLVSDEFRVALENEDRESGAFDMRALRTRNLKDIGRIQAWKLSRAGTEPGADRRRNMRWERLEGVLRELDELRDRGEKAVNRGALPDGDTPADDVAADDVPADHDGSVAVQAGRGHSLGPELEAPLERGQRSSP